ncbi:CBS domain-containing protein [Desulfoplanes formicivorans]|uniref:Polya polymerase n=1 Tax=Desulfoplanes formicivorans TaxID=1592317 RepID=A0A194AJP0_9BACT|nr:CBS domain-containing protein [Desulfoplanes formicivorans]GAU09271.1 polya polymerase [Desulfoplanes formicivorans]
MTKQPAHTIITSHANADFDALSAIVAAGKLYEDAVLIFPGSQERNLKNFFIQSATYLFNFKSAKEIDLSSVRRLVLVDTRQKDRILHVAAVLDNPHLEIHIYDHHPDSPEDLHGQHNVVKPWGSATAIIALILREKKVVLSPDEATIMGLGIYEDTGNFTFSSTTFHDLEAAAWLARQGMDFNMVADLVNRELSADQIFILNSLLESANTHTIHGIDVVVADVSLDRYVGDFALLAHKLLEMENIRVLFALGRMQDRVQVVARSRTADVDVGTICTSLGGGGHPYAASASIKDRTLEQVKDELFALLYSQITPDFDVRSLCSTPAVVIEKNKTLHEAADLMTRYGLKAIPVVEPGTFTCVGILDHQLAEKAIIHHLGDVLVKEYMLRDFATVTQDMDLYPVMEIILGQGQRLVPVLDDRGDCSGVITRTDLIHTLVSEPARIPETLIPERRRERQIKHLLRERLPRKLFDFLVQVGELARDKGVNVYCVGGFVRDILLHLPNFDVDFVVEGDAIAFARAMARTFGGRVREHRKFKTAVVVLESGEKIDVATARLEYYEYPAALPTVELSSIKMDLFRRDFTINALAVQVNPDQFGRLVDFFGGQKDIKNKTIRVLHSLSFVEDPTRIIRAIRFAQRFGFSIGGQTERLIKNAVELNIFHKLSGSRIFHEIRLMLAENKPVACLKEMARFNLLKAIHPMLTMDPAKQQILEEIEKVVAWYRLLYLEPSPCPWLVYLLGLCAGFNDAQVQVLVRRLNLTKKQACLLTSLRHSIRKAIEDLFRWEQGKQATSELFFILEPLALEGVLYLMARSRKESMRKHISLFLTQLRTQTIDITGKDLQALGIASGPIYGQILRAVTAAKLDNDSLSREEQLRMAREMAARSR